MWEGTAATGTGISREHSPSKPSILISGSCEHSRAVGGATPPPSTGNSRCRDTGSPGCSCGACPGAGQPFCSGYQKHKENQQLGGFSSECFLEAFLRSIPGFVCLPPFPWHVIWESCGGVGGSRGAQSQTHTLSCISHVLHPQDVPGHKTSSKRKCCT